MLATFSREDLTQVASVLEPVVTAADKFHQGVIRFQHLEPTLVKLETSYHDVAVSMVVPVVGSVADGTLVEGRRFLELVRRSEGETVNLKTEEAADSGVLFKCGGLSASLRQGYKEHWWFPDFEDAKKVGTVEVGHLVHGLSFVKNMVAKDAPPVISLQDGWMSSGSSTMFGVYLSPGICGISWRIHASALKPILAFCVYRHEVSNSVDDEEEGVSLLTVDVEETDNFTKLGLNSGTFVAFRKSTEMGLDDSVILSQEDVYTGRVVCDRGALVKTLQRVSVVLDRFSDRVLLGLKDGKLHVEAQGEGSRRAVEDINVHDISGEVETFNLRLSKFLQALNASMGDSVILDIAPQFIRVKVDEQSFMSYVFLPKLNLVVSNYEEPEEAE